MDYNYDFANSSIPIAPDGSYWIDEAHLVRAFFQTLPTKVADLLDVALAIYAADRWSRRDFKGAYTGQRQIHIKVGVRNPGLWTEFNMAQRLQEFLYWLSEDVWSFQFVRRQAAPYFAESDQFLFRLPPERPTSVSLFSGGLDSLAGLATDMLTNQSGSFTLVSGYTHNRLARQQCLQVQQIRQSAWDETLSSPKPTIYHVAIPFGLRKLKKQKEEKGQRTRGLVFLALGAAAALQAGVDTLWVYENGIGALNLPLNESQLGVDNYRGVHPRSLMMVECLFELVLEQPFRIRNPFLFHTKAEMCKSLKRAGLADTVQHTVSCDSFPLRLPGKPSQCGYCTSCLLRRQALFVAGHEEQDPGHMYLHDVLTSRADS